MLFIFKGKPFLPDVQTPSEPSDGLSFFLNVEETGLHSFRFRTESHGPFASRREVHRGKITGGDILQPLSCATGKVATQTWVYGKHYQVESHTFLSDVVQDSQKVAFPFFDFLWRGFVCPMPVVQVACVEYVFVFNMNSPRYAGIGGTESMYRDEVVAVAFSPSQVCRYAFRSGTPPTVDVAGEDDFLFPVGYGQVQDFRIEMVLMEMAGQKVDAFMRCGQCCLLYTSDAADE